ncbi:MAG: T9SS type A sorting domain-containing protein [Lewinellaceae bacterium]|nr:T9SS type A sorting domain-containing protein [Lewinellaceae bacterium]
MHFPTEWGNGQWATILTIPNNMASTRALGTFSVCPTNLQELNINYNLVDYPVAAAGNATSVRIGSLMPDGLRLFDVTLRATNQANLEWQVVSDKNFVRYQLEHSLDGNVFTRFAEVPAKGAGAADSRYEYQHDPMPSGTNYYRLNMIAANGRTEYSPVRIIQLERHNDWSVTPNPSKGDFALLLEADQPEEVQMSVLDTSGKTIYQDFVTVQPGHNRHTVRLNDLPSAMYQVSVRWSDGTTETKNLVINR